MTLKEKLDYLRQTLGASASAIARGSGVDRCSLSKFMNGERGLTKEKAAKIENYINEVLKKLD